MKRKSIKTSKKQIIEWGRNNIDECGYGVDASEMDTRCWRCGYERETERCHVIPHSRGGEDKPYNYRLFCHDCHLEQPNVTEYSATDKWIRETNVGGYDKFWEIREIWDEVYKETTIHFGQKGMNEATKNWFINEVVERIKERFNLPFISTIELKTYFKCIKGYNPTIYIDKE